MAGILRVIAENLARRRATVRLPGRVPPPAGYRGRVTMNPSRCMACGICAYVCVSDAITVSARAAVYSWTYEPGRCTFCSRCVDHCPGPALTMEAEPLPPYEKAGQLGECHLVALPPCPDCGRPTRPVTEEFTRRALDEASEDTRERLRLCERCRRRRLQRSLITAAFDGSPEEGR